MKISVLTPSYNSGAYIERAIKSVLSQRYGNFEHIIVDGGSKDDTHKIVAKYEHIKWVSEPDKGQSDAMNKAFGLSTGEIIVYLNADDYFSMNAFNSVINEFVNRPDVDIVVGNLEIINEQYNIKYNDSPSVDIATMVNIAYATTFPKNPVSYFYKRKVQEEIGLFPIDNHNTMDAWFIYRSFLRFNVRKIDNVLGTFFSSGDNKTSDISKMYCSLFKETSDFVREYNILPYEQWLLHQIEGFAHLKMELVEEKKKLRGIYNSNLWKIGSSFSKILNRIKG